MLNYVKFVVDFELFTMPNKILTFVANQSLRLQLINQSNLQNAVHTRTPLVSSCLFDTPRFSFNDLKNNLN